MTSKYATMLIMHYDDKYDEKWYVIASEGLQYLIV